MKRLFALKKQPLTRREVVARRQADAEKDVNVNTQSYRRNRTLNSRETASPMETSERLETHRLIKRRRKITRSLFGVVCGIVGVLSLLFQLTIYMSIQTPDAQSAKNAEKYEAVLNDYYTTRPAERFRFFLNSNDLTTFFLDKAPEVKTVRIEGNFLAKSTVKLIFRQPVAQWSSGEKTYFVDDSGVTFEQNYFDSPTVSVKDESGIPTESGQEVINRQFLSFLGQAVHAFSQNNIAVSEAVLPAHTVRQVWFRLEGYPSVIRMTVDREAMAQVKQAVITVHQLSNRGERPSYIDVRVDQRSFYK